MFGRKKQEPAPALGEPRPYGVRISELSAEDRLIIAQHRFEELDKLLKASGCATTPAPTQFAVNFHTGEHALIVQVDKNNPKRIGLMMIFTQPQGDIVKARWACFEATGKQFASKATVDEAGVGYTVTLSVGVYAEALHSFGDALKSYVDDIIKLYHDFVELVTMDDPLPE